MGVGDVNAWRQLVHFGGHINNTHRTPMITLHTTSHVSRLQNTLGMGRVQEMAVSGMQPLCCTIPMLQPPVLSDRVS